MSDKANKSKLSREERLAEQLRANLRRRKQASRKGKISSQNEDVSKGHGSDKPSP